ncbi:hypothetical protein [Hyphobacterium sp.]|uniref:hypothetical protein n=1 Tax=Hyphobacterium sp. TaxID=2004662 RepID=UPI003BA9F97E
MLAVLLTSLALFAADEPATFDDGCGWSDEGTIEEQFDRCMAGEWGYAVACEQTATVTHEGFTEADGDFCPIDYLTRDPHTGGFRVGFQCAGDERVVTVLRVQDGIMGSPEGHSPIAWRCEAD